MAGSWCYCQRSQEAEGKEVIELSEYADVMKRWKESIYEGIALKKALQLIIDTADARGLPAEKLQACRETARRALAKEENP